MRPILVTGAAGFIGYHLAERLLREGRQVVGLDNLNSYYSVDLKIARLDRLRRHSSFTFERIDLARAADLTALFQRFKFDVVFNLAAQAGVRHSLSHPQDYVQSNLVGFVNILEACRHNKVGHLVFASSSSVYGAVTALPYSVNQRVDHPLNVYAASKRANELLAHSYAHLFQLPCTGVRFFTVYGPWGRPDMAMFLFAKAILGGQPIDVFNNGEMERDFTYIEDVVEALTRLGDKPAMPDLSWSGDSPNPATSLAPFRLYNVGNHSPTKLMRLIEILERELGAPATKNYLPMQPGDVPATFADVDDLAHAVDFAPRTPIEDGVKKFVAWYRHYHGV